MTADEWADLAGALESALFAFAVAHEGAEPTECTSLLLAYRHAKAEQLVTTTEPWPDEVLDRIQRELAGAETPLYLLADDILRVLETADAVPSITEKESKP
jgi:hypothetical protein